MKPHSSLTTERVADRRFSNAGEGFRQRIGLNGNLEKLFHVAVTRGHQALPAGTQKVSEKSCASERISPNPCPACICGERHAERRGAPPCDFPEMAHSATVGAGQHRTTGNSQTAHRRPPWTTSASGSLRPPVRKIHNTLKPFGKNLIWPDLWLSLIGDQSEIINIRCSPNYASPGSASNLPKRLF